MTALALPTQYGTGRENPIWYDNHFPPIDPLAAIATDRGSEPCTYCVQAEAGGPVKIGRSTLAGLKSRVKSLQTGSPDLLVVRGVRSGDCEALLHDLFSEVRLRRDGEWFEACRALLDFFPGIEIPTAVGGDFRRGFEYGYRLGIQAGLAEFARDIESRLEEAGDRLAADLDGDAAYALYRSFESPSDLASPSIARIRK